MNISADSAAGTLRVILLSASYTPDIDSHTRYSHVSAHEINVTGPIAVGYFSGGQAVSASVSFLLDTVNDRSGFDAADNSWTNSTITARYIVLLKQRNNGSNKELDNLIAYIDMGSNQTSSSGIWTIQWNDAGILLFN